MATHEYKTPGIRPQTDSEIKFIQIQNVNVKRIKGICAEKNRSIDRLRRTKMGASTSDPTRTQSNDQIEHRARSFEPKSQNRSIKTCSGLNVRSLVIFIMEERRQSW